MRRVVVAIADCKLSRDPDTVLVTHALGSCIAVSVYDWHAQVGGLLHFMLPTSGLQPRKALVNPFMFADTGVRLLLQEAHSAGLEMRRTLVCLAGAAQIERSCHTFDIGKRNEEAVRDILRKYGLKIHLEALGGSHPRTASLDIASGHFSTLQLNV